MAKKSGNPPPKKKYDPSMLLAGMKPFAPADNTLVSTPKREELYRPTNTSVPSQRSTGQKIIKGMETLGDALSMPQRTAMQLVTGDPRTPGERLAEKGVGGFGQFAADMVLDPLNLLGVGMLRGAAKTVGRTRAMRDVNNTNRLSHVRKFEDAASDEKILRHALDKEEGLLIQESMKGKTPHWMEIDNELSGMSPKMWDNLVTGRTPYNPIFGGGQKAVEGLNFADPRLPRSLAQRFFPDLPKYSDFEKFNPLSGGIYKAVRPDPESLTDHLAFTSGRYQTLLDEWGKAFERTKDLGIMDSTPFIARDAKLSAKATTTKQKAVAGTLGGTWLQAVKSGMGVGQRNEAKKIEQEAPQRKEVTPIGPFADGGKVKGYNPGGPVWGGYQSPEAQEDLMQEVMATAGQQALTQQAGAAEGPSMLQGLKSLFGGGGQAAAGAGPFVPSPLGAAVGMAAQFLPNKNNEGLNNFEYTKMGASVGSMFGPLGAGIGAAAGFVGDKIAGPQLVEDIQNNKFNADKAALAARPDIYRQGKGVDQADPRKLMTAADGGEAGGHVIPIENVEMAKRDAVKAGHTDVLQAAEQGETRGGVIPGNGHPKADDILFQPAGGEPIKISSKEMYVNDAIFSDMAAARGMSKEEYGNFMYPNGIKDPVTGMKCGGMIKKMSGGGEIAGVPRDRVQTLYQRLSQEGYSPAAIAGIVGNLMHEAPGLAPQQEIDQTAGRGGYGIAQWTGPRRTLFENWARDNNRNVEDYDANVDYLISELNGQFGNHWSPREDWTEGRVTIDDLKAAEDPAYAARVFESWWLRPDATRSATDTRVANAQQVYETLGTLTPSKPEASAEAPAGQAGRTDWIMQRLASYGATTVPPSDATLRPPFDTLRKAAASGRTGMKQGGKVKGYQDGGQGPLTPFPSIPGFWPPWGTNLRTQNLTAEERQPAWQKIPGFFPQDRGLLGQRPAPQKPLQPNPDAPAAGPAGRPVSEVDDVLANIRADLERDGVMPVQQNLDKSQFPDNFPTPVQLLMKQDAQAKDAVDASNRAAWPSQMATGDTSPGGLPNADDWSSQMSQGETEAGTTKEMLDNIKAWPTLMSQGPTSPATEKTKEDFFWEDLKEKNRRNAYGQAGLLGGSLLYNYMSERTPVPMPRKFEPRHLDLETKAREAALQGDRQKMIASAGDRGRGVRDRAALSGAIAGADMGARRQIAADIEGIVNQERVANNQLDNQADAQYLAALNQRDQMDQQQAMQHRMMKGQAVSNSLMAGLQLMGGTNQNAMDLDLMRRASDKQTAQAERDYLLRLLELQV